MSIMRWMEAIMRGNGNGNGYGKWSQGDVAFRKWK